MVACTVFHWALSSLVLVLCTCLRLAKKLLAVFSMTAPGTSTRRRVHKNMNFIVYIDIPLCYSLLKPFQTTTGTGAIMGIRSQENKNLIQKEREIFARNFKRARREAGLTQEDIIKRTGLTQPFISEIETGKSTVSMDNAHLLAKAVNQPLWKLLNPSEK